MVIFCIGLILSGLVQLFVTIRAADGRLKRNRFGGIRTRLTLASDENWLTAHQAARPLGLRAGTAMLASGLVVPAGRVGPLLALAGVAFGIVCLYLSTRAGVRAVFALTAANETNADGAPSA